MKNIEIRIPFWTYLKKKTTGIQKTITTAWTTFEKVELRDWWATEVIYTWEWNHNLYCLSYYPSAIYGRFMRAVVYHKQLFGWHLWRSERPRIDDDNYSSF